MILDRVKKTVALSALTVFCFSCTAFKSRPVKQIAYAEAAMHAAMLASAETNPDSAPLYQLARDQLSRARAYYRLKNFKEARLYAVKSRRLAEEAEWRAMRANSDSKDGQGLGK